MAEYTKDEALTFIETLRLTIGGRTGFKWLVGRLADLSAYIESLAAENERLNDYLDAAGLRDDYESRCAIAADAVPSDEGRADR